MARQRNSLEVLVCDEAQLFLGQGVALHRYTNARKLMASADLSLVKVGERINRDYGFVAAYLANVPKKRLGEKVARLLEEGLGVSPYSLDTPCEEFLRPPEHIGATHAAQVGYAQAMLESIACDEKRQQVLALIQLAISEKITASDLQMLEQLGRHMEGSKQAV